MQMVSKFVVSKSTTLISDFELRCLQYNNIFHDLISEGERNFRFVCVAPVIEPLKKQ